MDEDNGHYAYCGCDDGKKNNDNDGGVAAHNSVRLKQV